MDIGSWMDITELKMWASVSNTQHRQESISVIRNGQYLKNNTVNQTGSGH